MKKHTSLEHTIKKVVAEQNYRNQPIDEAVGAIGTDKPHDVPRAFFKSVHVQPRKGEGQIPATGTTRAGRNYEMEKAGVHKEEAEAIDEVAFTIAKEIGKRTIFKMPPAPTGNLPAVVGKTPKPTPTPKPAPAPKPAEPPPFKEPAPGPKPFDMPPAPDKVPATRPDVKPQVKPDVKPETIPQVKPDVKPDVKVEPAPQIKTDVKPSPKPEVLPLPAPLVSSKPNQPPPVKPGPTKRLPPLMPDFGAGMVTASEPAAIYGRKALISRVAHPYRRKIAAHEYKEETRYDIKNVARPDDSREDSIVGRPKDGKSKYTKQAEIIRKVVEEKKIIINKKKEENQGKNPLVDTEPTLKYNPLDQGSKDVR